MKVVVAMDSMKGSLTSREAGNAAREGILRAIPDAVVTVHTVADGGEGTAALVTSYLGGRFEKIEVVYPQARYRPLRGVGGCRLRIY